MPFLFERLYRRLGRAYFFAYLAFELFSAAAIALATLGLISLYQEMSKEEFLRLLVVSQAATLAGVAWTAWKSWELVRPITDWIVGGRGSRGAIEAWRSAVSAPRDFVACNGWQPFAIVAAPIAVYATYELGLPLYSAAIVFAAVLVSIGYAVVLNFFAAEMALRPVVRDAGAHLPIDFDMEVRGVPLRWKLLGSLPLINVITGILVAGLSQKDAGTSLDDLGVDVVVAVIVAFTISLELTLLVLKSVVEPVDELLEATERLQGGDLSVRVPVASADEMGRLAASFNQAVEGLAEREALHGALGSYAGTEVAERVLEEGEALEGEEAEVSVLFVDIRDFTAFADRSSAQEVVGLLNEFFGVIVPVLHRHGGHANKFVGDGLMAVFGAPRPLDDHADRALAAAREIVGAVGRRFGDRVRIGIGVNSGPVMVGTIGGGGRLEFAVIGDPVNVAARVESATRETGDTILITEAARCLLRDPDAAGLEPRGELPLRGKPDPIPIHAAPVSVPTAAPTP